MSTAAPAAIGVSPAPSETSDRQKIKAIVAASSGNLVEWYDFYAYAFTSIYFASAFFPSSSPTGQLLATAGIFAVGFFMRPLGGWIFGRIADRRGPGVVTRLGALLVVLSFAAMSVTAWLDRGAAIAVLVVLAVVFDFGVQAALVAHQTIVYSLDPAARSRLNALLFTGMFIGMATGAALGSLLLAHWGWLGVTGLATVASAAALVVRLGADE